MKKRMILLVSAACLFLASCGASSSSSSSKYTPTDWHARMDSVPPPPMDGNALRANFEQVKYDKSQENDDPEILREKLKKLDELRRNGSWVARFVNANSDNQDEIINAQNLSRQIHGNYGMLQIRMEELDKARGDSAMFKFTHVQVADVFDYDGQTVNRELLDDLKENLFYSDRPPQVRSASGAGRYFAKFRPDLDPKSGFIGYIANLSDEFNLIILRLDSGEKLAIIYDKNADSETYGPIGVF